MNFLKLDQNTLFTLTNDEDESITLAMSLANDDELLNGFKSSINLEDNLLVVSFVNDNSENIKIAVTEADRLKEVLRRKYPEMEEEDLNIEVEKVQNTLKDFGTSLNTEEKEEENENGNEDGNEDEWAQYDAANFSKEIKDLFNQTQNVQLMNNNSGKVYKVIDVIEDGIKVEDTESGKKGIFRDNILNEYENIIEII